MKRQFLYYASAHIRQPTMVILASNRGTLMEFGILPIVKNPAFLWLVGQCLASVSHLVFDHPS